VRHRIGGNGVPVDGKKFRRLAAQQVRKRRQVYADVRSIKAFRDVRCSMG
jgi:hypothetical protein